MSRLALYLLGPPRLELDGELVQISRRKAVALLAYLAVTGGHHSRDSLATLLWPEYDQSRARADLRRTLSVLNRTLGEEWLTADRETAVLSPDADPSTGSGQALWLDVDQFYHLLAACETHGHPALEVCPDCVTLLEEAVVLYRDGFMAGFTLRDSPAFDEWQFFQTEGLRDQLASALERLVRYHGSQGAYEPAIAYARRRLALDPFHEPAHCHLMRLYAQAGRRSAALRQYRKCVRILEEELDVPPSNETTALYERIRAERSRPAEREVTAPAPTPPSILPPHPPAFLRPAQDAVLSQEEELVEAERGVFVTRERELAQLDGFLDTALAGEGQVVFVAGGAGRGKTALMHEFARRAMDAHPDLLVASGNCNAYSGVGDPYLPFREVIAMLTGDVETRWSAGSISREHAQRLWAGLPFAVQALVNHGPSLINTVMPGGALLSRAVAVAHHGTGWLEQLKALSEQGKAGASDLEQSALFEQVTNVLHAVAAQHPLLLMLDDMQWADAASISLLFHLGRRLEGVRIMIVGAYRPEEVALGRDGERHPLEKVLTEFKRCFGDVWVDLARVDESEGRRFVDSFLDTEPNRLEEAFRGTLSRRTGGHPLFTVELLRAMQGRGDLVYDADGRWVEGPSLNWERLPARVEAVVEERVGRLEEGLRDILAIASVEGAVFTAEVVAQVQKADEREMVRRLSSELDKRHHLVSAEGIRRMGSQRLSLYRFRHILFQRYLYDSLDKVERPYLHEDVGNVLEGLYGEEMEEVAVQLALHFQRAGMAEKAVAYLRRAGDRAVRLSANEEAIAHFTSALALLNTLPETLERNQQELVLQTALFSPLAASKGYGAPEMGQAFNRARELGRQMEDSAQLFKVIHGLVGFNMLRAELKTAQEQTRQLLRIAHNLEDVDLLLQANRLMGEILYSIGELGPARTYLEQAVALYDPQLHRSHAFLYGEDPGMALAIYSAVNLWMLGYSEKAMESSKKALALAKESAHPYSLAYATSFDCIHYILRRKPQVAQDKAEAVIALSSKHGFNNLLAFGIVLQGWALAEQRQEKGIEQMNQTLAMIQAAGAQLWGPSILGLLAQGYMKAGRTEEGLATLAGALKMANENEERWYEAELYRLRGELFVMQGDKTEAEANYHKAIEVARGQGAKFFELRATVSVCRLWEERGKSAQARQMLEEIYGWFTEGFDTVDLQEARALLEELSKENA